MALESSETEILRGARRVGDAQRAECADTLADAFAQGELSHEEFSARTGLCLEAVTGVELDRLTADLGAKSAGPDRADDSHRAISVTKFIVFASHLHYRVQH